MSNLRIKRQPQSKYRRDAQAYRAIQEREEKAKVKRAIQKANKYIKEQEKKQLAKRKLRGKTSTNGVKSFKNSLPKIRLPRAPPII
jgi:hypothetical protein